MMKPTLAPLGLMAPAFTLLVMTSTMVHVVAAASKPLSFEVINDNSIVSAMMMGLVNEDTVMIIDKVEDNDYKFPNGKPAWTSLLDLRTNQVKPIQANSNAFCAGGGVLGNGTWAVFGGNTNVNETGYGGDAAPSGKGPYKALDGGKSIRFVEPTADFDQVHFIDDGSQMMATLRWYPGVEILSTGEALLLGGMSSGGFVNRNPIGDPSDLATQGGGAQPTFEFFPSRGGPLQRSQTVIDAVGLNTYAHMYTMPSGRVFVQANVTTTLWDVDRNVEERLEDMPNNIVRVYPASGATAMLPLTKENNYEPTILFCGGATLTEWEWGTYAGPNIDVTKRYASKDCSSIKPEFFNGTSTGQGYVHEENLPEGRTMGQFIHLPDGTMLLLNGAERGTAGYTQKNATYIVNGIDTEGLAQDPVYTPVLYDPSKPLGSRISRDGFGSSTIARLYHSTALLLPGGSVLVAGSNPHMNVVKNMPQGTTPQGYNTEYRLEKWYPSYMFKTRPAVSNIPSVVPFGGQPFQITVSADSIKDSKLSPNYKAANTKIMVIRPGFTTHGLNMGQRSLQLESTYEVMNDGSITLTVNPFPANPHLFVAGPAFLFVTVDGVPSIGKQVMVGADSASMGRMPWTPVVGAQLQELPAGKENSKFTDSATVSATVSKLNDSSSLSLGAIVGLAAGGAALLALLGLLTVCLVRRRAASTASAKKHARLPTYDGKGHFSSVAMNDRYGNMPKGGIMMEEQQHKFAQAQGGPGSIYSSQYAYSAPGTPLMHPGQALPHNFEHTRGSTYSSADHSTLVQPHEQQQQQQHPMSPTAYGAYYNQPSHSARMSEDHQQHQQYQQTAHPAAAYPAYYHHPTMHSPSWAPEDNHREGGWNAARNYSGL